MSEQELEPCMNCGRAFAVIEVYMFAGLRKYAAVCCTCGFRTAIFDKESDARAVWNGMKDRVLAQACEAQFANPIENALRAKSRKLEAEIAKMRASLRSSDLQFAGLQSRVTALEAVLDEIRLIARSVLPSEEVIADHQAHWNGKEMYQIAKKAESALKGEVQK